MKKPEWLKNAGKQALEWANNAGNAIVKFGTEMLEKAKKLLPTAKEAIQEAGENAGETIAAAAQEAIS